MTSTENSFGKWEVTLIDCGDGSGDCYVEFPKELLAKLDWHEGDIINIDIVDDLLCLAKINN